jgi:hypothetical protein
MIDQRYAATKQEQTASNIEHHANRQVFPAYPERARRS